MAVNETIITGRMYRVWDKANSIWKRFSYWTKASDVEMNDGTTVENTVSQLKTNLTPSRYYETDTAAEADISNIPDGAIVYTNDGDDVLNARQIRFDDGTQAGSNVETQINNINNDLNDKVERMTNVSGYQTVDVLGYNPTTKKLGLKVNGADTVIPFNSGISNTFSYSLTNNKGGNTDVDIFIPQDVSSITINYTAKSSYVSTGVYVDGTFHDVTSSPITYPVSTKITLHIYDQYTNNSATFKVIFNN